MSRKQPKARTAPPQPSAGASGPATVNGSASLKTILAVEANNDRSWSGLFSNMACETARLAGKPLVFLSAVSAVILWAATGPLFGFSDTWQLIINTSTTIITFLMVFLIQHTQNRDTLALQLKLAELIIAMRGAENSLATAEDMSEADLEQLHEIFRSRADQTLEHLNRRRAGKTT
jgi:low affinity Fe/Cu permease